MARCHVTVARFTLRMSRSLHPALPAQDALAYPNTTTGAGIDEKKAALPSLPQNNPEKSTADFRNAFGSTIPVVLQSGIILFAQQNLG